MYIGTFLGKLFSFRKVQSFFRGFRNLSCKCVDSQRKVFATVVKIAFSVAKEAFLMKKKFVQKFVTSTFLEFGKLFRFLATKLRQACQNIIVHVRRTFWGETTLLAKRPNFSSIPEFEQTVFRILTRIFGQGGHNRILRAQLKFFFNFWRREMKENKLLFENFAFLSFSDFERKRSLVLLQAWLRQSCQNLFVHVQTNILRKKRFFGKFDFFHHFRSSSIKYSEFWQKFFGRVVTTAFYMYIGTFLGKLFSFRKVQSFFRGFRNLSCKCVDSQRKVFATVVKIAFSVAKEAFLMKKKICSKICNFNIFGVRETFSFFGNKVTPGLPKHHCAC